MDCIGFIKTDSFCIENELMGGGLENRLPNPASLKSKDDKRLCLDVPWTELHSCTHFLLVKTCLIADKNGFVLYRNMS